MILFHCVIPSYVYIARTCRTLRLFAKKRYPFRITLQYKYLEKSGINATSYVHSKKKLTKHINGDMHRCEYT